jgi:3-hydroxyisobutyrate dehydrogenase/glyoxylate/succinic semialdehyde reductase
MKKAGNDSVTGGRPGETFSNASGPGPFAHAVKERSTMKIGFIGLGIMGSRMAANLRKKGHELVVHNRTRQKADALLAGGAIWAPSPADVAKQVKVIFTMLSKPDAVAETALTGKHGFLNRLAAGSLWVDCSTVNPSFSRLMANEAGQRKVRFIDAPVGGTKGPAEEGQLLFFAGGEQKDVEEAMPLLEAMGKAVFHVGGHGMGTSMKMVNNLILAQAMVAFSEALVLGESLGFSRDMLFQTLLSSPVTAPFLSFKRAKIEAGDFVAEFPLQWMHKDAQLVAETAYETGVALPATNVVKEVYALAVRNGLGEEDFSAVYKMLSEKK